MRALAAIRCSVVTLAIFVAVTPSVSRAADGASLRSTTTPVVSSNILIGFVGGFVGHDNPHHGPVQLARRIRPEVPSNTYVRVFENRRRRQAYEAIVRLLDTDRDGVLSAEEKARAHIVLFGQSWGASAAVTLARDLRRKGIPVLLTVQVDSVAKIWQNDSVIPDNVAEAVNFYQTRGIIHGRTHITAADPSRTDVLGNYRMDYKKDPVECPEASWFDRVFTPGHMQSECDPHLWSQIQNLVREHLVSTDNPSKAPSAVSLAANPHP